MNHRFSPRALARFGRKKVRLGGLPRPLAWMAGFLGGQALGREAPTPPPYPAAVDGHYLSFCAGEGVERVSVSSGEALLTAAMSPEDICLADTSGGE